MLRDTNNTNNTQKCQKEDTNNINKYQKMPEKLKTKNITKKLTIQ